MILRTYSLPAYATEMNKCWEFRTDGLVERGKKKPISTEQAQPDASVNPASRIPNFSGVSSWTASLQQETQPVSDFCYSCMHSMVWTFTPHSSISWQPSSQLLSCPAGQSLQHYLPGLFARSYRFLKFQTILCQKAGRTDRYIASLDHSEF
jgi:hypothetical protein